jgi:hypothetical protein
MPSQLTVYNDALGQLQARSIAGLTENREPKRVLDSYFPDAVRYCLEQGQFLWAKRVAQIDASTTIIPQFGYANAFSIPLDWVRTVLLSTQPTMDPPLKNYSEETGFWFADTTPIFAAYVSIDPQYGMNMGAWPEVFADFLATRLARKACLRLTGDKALLTQLIKDEEKAKRIAKGDDAMNDPPMPPPMGSWVRSRRGGVRGGIFANTGGSVAMGPFGDD